MRHGASQRHRPSGRPRPGPGAASRFRPDGLALRPGPARRRFVYALILVAVWSRHMFVCLTFTQTTENVIEGMEMGWAFFGGIFPVLIYDNLLPVITKAEPTEPRINDTFSEYSPGRGFLVDAARTRHPRDKARCERQVPFIRSRFFAGEEFVDLAAPWSGAWRGLACVLMGRPSAGRPRLSGLPRKAGCCPPRPPLTTPLNMPSARAPGPGRASPRCP